MRRRNAIGFLGVLIVVSAVSWCSYLLDWSDAAYWTALAAAGLVYSAIAIPWTFGIPPRELLRRGPGPR
jgi:hypothetical protein